MLKTLGRNPISYSYSINNVIIQHVSHFKDLGVTVDPLLCFEMHINEICAKANQRSALILKCFNSRDPHLLMKAFTVFVRPLLEYASSVWCPYKATFINKIESVQRRFSKRLHGISKMPYTERLQFLKVETLETRRLKADLTLYYKIINNLVNLNVTDMFKFLNNPKTRGHSLQLIKPRCSTNFFLHGFACRAINAWNKLDSGIVYSPSIASFKHKLNAVKL